MLIKKDKTPETKSLIVDACTWIDVERPTQDDLDALSRGYKLPLMQQDFLTKSHIAKTVDYGDDLLVILHFPSSGEKSDTIRSSQLMVFLGRDHLVTLHNEELQPLAMIRLACKSDEKQRQSYMGKGAAYLLYRILDSLVEGISPILEDLEHSLDEIEDRVFDNKTQDYNEVTLLRRKVADLRRIVFPLTQERSGLTAKSQRYSPEDVSVYFNDLSDHIGKKWSNLDEIREMVEIYKDTDFLLSTNRTNQILAILTIVTTLSIPATVIGTLYGMNIRLPGDVHEPYLFWGTYTTFILALILSIVPALAMYLIFRRKGWI